MTELTLSSCEPRTLRSHMAMYGLAAILESEGARNVRVQWDETANPRPVISASDIDGAGMAALLLRHAQSRNADESWLRASIALKGTARGLMSPRLTQFEDSQTWSRVQRSRWEVIDMLASSHAWLDLQFIAALGEPCYWSFSRKGDHLQDDGASRWEMQPRQHGSEFVGTRLRKLADAVALRAPDSILPGLQGELKADENTTGAAPGLDMSGPADNALAWCALWGISQFPTALRVNRTANTAGHLSFRRSEWFYVPVWHEPWRPSRVRSILASQFLRVLASEGISETVAGIRQQPCTDTNISEARAWLKARGVTGVIRFPIQRFGSANAPERRALSGEPISVLASARATT